MANLNTNGTNMTGNYQLTKSTGTVFTFQTASSYAPKDIAFTVTAPTATPTFKGGAVSGSTSVTGDSCSISDSTNNSGVSITATGSASRAEVQYDAAVNAWVNKSASAKAYDAGTATALTPKTYYINGVTIAKPPSGTTRTFSITVPNGGDSTITFVFNVDSSGNVVVNEGTSS